MDLADTQGIVVHGYGNKPSSRFYLLRFDACEPREWLRRALYDVSSAREGAHDVFRFNLAFSVSGLRALGLSGATLATFPREFRQGMAHPERSIALGDAGEDAPEHWEFGGSEAKRVDALALLYAPNDVLLEQRARTLEDQLEKFDVSYEAEDARLPEDGREHFGFVDGLSQPYIRGSGRKRARRQRSLASGEFVLGYENAYGMLPSSPRAPAKRGTRELPPLISGRKQMDLGRNGTYLVLRKLQQRVHEFWRFARHAAEALGEEHLANGAELCAARLVGRWPNGAPLVSAPNVEPTLGSNLEEFSFRADPDGQKCPIGAHVRRANPRDMLGDDAGEARVDADRHRIVRRGRIYGPKVVELFSGVDDGQKRGLYFMALNANIRRQFEFIQQTWLNGPKFGGLVDELDPLVGKDFVANGSARERPFSVPAEPVRRRLMGLPRFVRLRGGAYFFLPSLRALNYLAEG